MDNIGVFSRSRHVANDEDMPVSENYWSEVRRLAKELGSDGCTGVSEMYRDCCYEHDIAYRTGADLYGEPMTREQADGQFCKCIQGRSPFGKLSPMALWRWAGVRLFAGKAWKGQDNAT